MEEAAELANYLPLSFKTPKEQEYIEFLWDAFETNYSNKKHQFAFLTYHMLTMSFVYFNIWQIKQNQPAGFLKATYGFTKDNEDTVLSATSPFTFSEIGESAIFRFLKLIDCDNGKIGSYTKLVKDRNASAHSNGNIFYSTETALDLKITEILRVVDEIQTHSAPMISAAIPAFSPRAATQKLANIPTTPIKSAKCSSTETTFPKKTSSCAPPSTSRSMRYTPTSAALSSSPGHTKAVCRCMTPTG